MDPTTGHSHDELRNLKIKLKKLGRVVRVLLAEEPVKTQRALESYAIDLDVFLQPNTSDSPCLEAVWDDKDSVYRCPQCMWELERGVCSSGCRLEFDTDVQDDADYTSNEAFNTDRVAQPRGCTPLEEVGHLFRPPSQCYSGGLDEYEQLRRRGATRLMCETFHLEFSSDAGIVAWADGNIYEEFAGPLMQRGDFWKIMLGRRIQLDEDDPDGSAFMEALLEDAVIFPLVSTCKWETIEESPGIWVTRVIGITPRGAGDSSDDSGDSMASIESEDAWEQAQREFELEDEALEAGYVVPSLPVNADHYEASDAEVDSESDVDMAEGGCKTEETDDGCASDSGWTYAAHVRDTCWMPESEDVVPSAEDGANGEGSDEDSADSDFDSDEILSGDEASLAAGRRWLATLPQ
ncbi:hypothetical protein DFH09DRAFT_1123524 [Mycena vulgaris]|nr:hypothetical protein DFH09DRAFT_1123524 [Mycena vulgaris]